MKAINRMIEEGLKENQNELKKNLMRIDSIQEIISKNKNFSFDIQIFYNRDTQLLNLTYTLNKNNHKIELDFQMRELTFNFNCINISTAIIVYAISYFNGNEFKTNIGDFDGDIYVGIKEFLDSFYDYDEDIKSNILIVDKTLRKVL